MQQWHDWLHRGDLSAKPKADSNGTKSDGPQRILVPVKGEGVDEEALRLATQTARRSKGTVYVLYIIEVNRTLPLDAQLDAEMRRASSILEQAEEKGQQKGCKMETCLLQARNVGPAVVEEAIERHADLIVLGMSYKNRFGEFSLGDTIPYILKNAPTKVWLCREAIPIASPIS